MNIYLENPEIVKQVIFEFVQIYGNSNKWSDVINELFKEEVERRLSDAN